MIINKVFDPNGREMSNEDLAEWANSVHQMHGCTNSPYTPEMFSSEYKDGCQRTFPGILSGSQCNCLNGGEFILLPLRDKAVSDGQKAYMQCRVCKGYSHL